jgi:hypothetical protein
LERGRERERKIGEKKREREREREIKREGGEGERMSSFLLKAVGSALKVFIQQERAH